MRQRLIVLAALLAAWSPSLVARAEAPHPTEATSDEDAMPPPGYLPGYAEHLGLGLSPHVPGEQTVLPGGVAPAFGAPLRPSEGGKFDFKGHLQLGARAGLGSREDPQAGQSRTTWHGSPIVPAGNAFESSGVVPYVWSALEFSYSTPGVTATVQLGAWSFSESMQASGNFVPNAQLWVNDAYLTYTPRALDPVKLSFTVGVFQDRYGNLQRYTPGHYGPIIAGISGVGETLAARVPLPGPLTLTLEHGIKSSLGRPPANVPTGPTNGWAKPWEGQTFVNHGHLGLDIAGIVQPGLHFVSAFARDDQGDNVPLGSLRAGYDDYLGGPPELHPELDHADGSIQVLGADLRVDFQDFGYLGIAAAQVSAEHVRSVAGVLSILGASHGRDLMEVYLGRNNDMGKGKLSLLGAEYSVSLGKLLRRPDDFWGDGPDLTLGAWGLFAHIDSDDPSRDGEDKYKFGVEATYSALSWLAVVGRFDRVVPYTHAPRVPIYVGQNDNSYSVATARAIFRSDWEAREALTLQYSRFVYRENFHNVTLITGGYVSTVAEAPDQHLLALYGTLWW